MGDESRFTEETWKTWLEPFHAVRMLMDAGLEDREHAVNWLKGRLRSGQLRAGGLHMQLVEPGGTDVRWVYGRYKSATWEHIATIPWKDDFWISGDYTPDDPLDALFRKADRDEFTYYLNDVRFAPALILDFCARATATGFPLMPSSQPKREAGGRPPKAFWDRLWAAIAAQLYNGDLKPVRQADIERAMHEWLATNSEEAGETAIRAKAKLLWEAINTEVEN